jgi:hypothetical protein
MTLCLGALFIQPDVLKSQFIGSRLQEIGISLVIVVLCDLWFSRRMGFTLDDRGLKLHYAFHWKRVKWEQVVGFEWRRWTSPRTEWIWIKVDHGGPAVRVPTVQRAPKGNEGWLSYRVFASSKLSARGGQEVDAITTLERALEGSRAVPAAKLNPSRTDRVPRCLEPYPQR